MPIPRLNGWGVAFAAALAAGSPGFASVGEARPPNLVVILADDLGYGDLGCYGSTRHATPNIDRLANEGTRFTEFYVSSSVCTPSRVALLTARHPVRVGFHTLLWPTTEGGLPAKENTLAELLKARGYATGLAGKWHLGHSAPAHLPLAHGFDEFYGMPYPNDMGPGHPVEASRGESWPPMPMMNGNAIVEAPVDVNLLTQQYTAAAVSFIARHHHEPFFLFMSHAAPHSIVGASPDFRGTSKNGLYGDAVQEVDWSTGEILRTLRALGLEENTLVVFSSDNGAMLRAAYQGREAAFARLFPDGTTGTNAPLRGGKQSTFEGGVRVPAIWRWPGVIPAGQTIRHPAWIADLMPTFLEFAGIPLPADRAYDGRSLRAPLTGQGERDGDEFAFGNEDLTALRQGDWKLVLPRQPRFVPADGEGPMLFNLAHDPGESTNLVAGESARAARLAERLQEISAAYAIDPVSK
jgi:arylsulfatase A